MWLIDKTQFLCKVLTRILLFSNKEQLEWIMHYKHKKDHITNIWIVKDTNNEIESILEIEKNISF